MVIYADKASHFRASREPTPQELLQGRQAESQIQRALRELGIQYLPAHSPQAKGRVERSFKTAQDRLVKGMRLEGVSTIEEANRHLRKKFLPLWNRRFTVEAASPADAHRAVTGLDLRTIFSIQTERTVANDYTIRHNRIRYQIPASDVAPGLRGSRVVVEEHLCGRLRIRGKKGYLRHHEIDESKLRPRKDNSTRRFRTPVGLRPPSVRDRPKPHKPAPDHPWNKRTIL